MKLEHPSHTQQSCLGTLTSVLEDLAHIYSVIIGLIISLVDFRGHKSTKYLIVNHENRRHIHHTYSLSLSDLLDVI